jgi:hypothetical protein
MTIELLRPQEEKGYLIEESLRIVGQLPNGEEVILGSNEVGFDFYKTDGKKHTLGKGEILILAEGVFAVGRAVEE